MNNEEKEVTINIVDMVAHALHQWKRVLIWSLIFMVVIGGFKSFQDYRSIKSKYENNTYSAMTANLTENQKNNVKNYFNRYESYKKRIEENQNYLENSLLMDIDSNKVSEYTVEYLVKSNYQDIITSFSSSTFDYDDYEMMASIMGNDAKPGYISEIISIEGDMEQDAYEIDTDKKGDVINGSFSNSYSGILTLKIKANERMTCEKLADEADAAIREHLEKVRRTGMDVEISELSTVYMEREDSELSEYQKEKIEEGAEIVNEYYKFISDADKTLDEAELKVFKYMIDKDQEVNDKVNWKKWSVIGFGIGFLLSIVVIFVNYLCIPGVKTYGEVEELTDEKEIGIVIQPTKSKILLGKLFHGIAQKMEFHGITVLPDKESIFIVCNRIEGICKGKESREVYLINDIKDGYTKEVVERCGEILKEKGLIVNFGNPYGSADDFKTLTQFEKVTVFLAITNKLSLPNSIKNNMAICKENGINIGGSFIISPPR